MIYINRCIHLYWLLTQGGIQSNKMIDFQTFCCHCKSTYEHMYVQASCILFPSLLFYPWILNMNIRRFVMLKTLPKHLLLINLIVINLIENKSKKNTCLYAMTKLGTEDARPTANVTRKIISCFRNLISGVYLFLYRK